MINSPIINEEPLERDILTGKPVGALKAAGMGIMKGGADIGGFVAMAGAGIEGLLAKGYEAIGFDEAADDLKKRQENFYKFYEDVIKPAKEYWTPDPALTSGAGQILHGVGGLVLPLLTGEAAVPLLIGSATMNTGADLAEQGVDAKTATLAAIGSGITTAAMIKIPAVGKKLWQTLGLIAVNPAVGIGQRAALQELLEAKGYKEAAKAYDPLDPTALAIDTVLGIFFGGMAHYGRARAKMPIELEDAIDTAASHQKNLKDTPFENTHKNNRVNLAAKEKAISDISEGKPVDVSEQIAELHSTETITPEKKQAWQMTKEEALQNASVNRYGRTEIAGVEPDYTVGMLQKKAEFSPEAWIENGHKRIIYKALEEGKPVPKEVLKDYPEIQELLQKMGPLKPSMPFKKAETPETIEARKTATDAINELHDTVDEVARLNGMEPEIVDMEQGSPEWLEMRLGKRMASETPAVLGLSPFMKPADLWAYKTGRKQFPETPAMTHGKLNEGYARDSINQIYHTEFKPSVMMKGEFGASLDGISPDGKINLEVKVPYGGKESQTWKETKAGKVPEHFRAQLQHQLMISGADEAWFVVYDRKTKHHLRLVEKPDPVMQKQIVEAWDKFWPHIAEDRPLESSKPTQKAPAKEAIIKSRFEGKTPDFLPELVISGGMPGSGKSTLLKNARINKKNFVDLNADHLKDEFSLGHEEASEITKKAFEKAVDEDYSVLYDSLLTNAELVIPQIEKVLKKGGKVHINYIYTDIETSASRAMARNLKGQTKRTVPDEAIIKGYNRSLPTFVEIFKRYKDNPQVEMRLLDNNVDFRQIKEVFDKRFSKDLEIKDEKLFDSLMSIEYNNVEGGRYERTEKADTGRIEGSRGEIESRVRSLTQSQSDAPAGSVTHGKVEEAASASELKPYITLKRPVRSKTVVEWIEKQGKINYNKEHFKGELDILAEKDPRFKTLISKKDKGLTLDELAVRAKDEGFIKKADPQELIDAIEKRKMRIRDEEDFFAREMEYNKPILNDPVEKMVESVISEKGDIPSEFQGYDNEGRPNFGSMRERIDDAKNDYHKTKNLEDVFKRIGNCLRNGG